jgi:hypothetical protein
LANVVYKKDLWLMDKKSYMKIRLDGSRTSVCTSLSF